MAGPGSCGEAAIFHHLYVNDWGGGAYYKLVYTCGKSDLNELLKTLLGCTGILYYSSMYLGTSTENGPEHGCWYWNSLSQ